MAAPELDPYQNDPTRWGHSMAHLSELMLPCLEAVGARSVVEIGAYAGDLTRVLVDWSDRSGARISAVDPAPQDLLVELERDRPTLELIRETSLDALPHIDVPDAVVIDGDHNYWTVREELRLIAERSADAGLPLLLFHDVYWPHGRRDDYFDPEQIPAPDRHPVVGEDAGIFPGRPGSEPGGLPYPKSAAHEGGPGNGVRTAIEDFVADHEQVRFVAVPAFFGFGVAFDRRAAWAGALAELLDPWDQHPLLERLEDNRVHHLATVHQLKTELWDLRERQARQEAVLRRMLTSSAFAVAERLSRLRDRAGVGTTQAVVSKDEIRRALDGEG